MNGEGTSGVAGAGRSLLAYWSPPQHGRLLISSAIGLVALLLLLPQFVRIKDNPPETKAKFNMHTIQLAIERYAVDHQGYFPQDLAELRSQEYMSAYPYNELERLYSGQRRPMKEVPFDALLRAGNFSYLPYADSSGGVVHYTLLLHGRDSDPGGDLNGDGKIDRVIFVLEGNRGLTSSASIPAIPELIRQQMKR